MIGQVIGQYRILEKIGQGGMGVVYKDVDVNLDRIVAIKMLTKELTQDENLIQRFRSEAKTQAQLNHPNVCTLFSLLKHKDHLFMVMEYVEGLTFEQMIKQRGPLPFQEIVPLFQQALFGLSRAHRMGIIHRDLKPANIIVNREGVVKVMDFGIARVVGDSRLTKTGLAVGTLFYMPPEQIQGKDVDYRADIYALGLTLYELLTGTLPFKANTEFEIMQAHVKETPQPPSKAYPYLPKVFDKALLKALAKDPEKRYQTVEEFSQALGMALQEALKAAPQTQIGQTIATPTAAAGLTMADTAMAPMPKQGLFGLEKKQLMLIGGVAGAFFLAIIIVLLAVVVFSGKKEPDKSHLSASSSSSQAPLTRTGPGPTSTTPEKVLTPDKPKVDLSDKKIPGLDLEKTPPKTRESQRKQPDTPKKQKQAERATPSKQDDSQDRGESKEWEGTSSRQSIQLPGDSSPSSKTQSQTANPVSQLEQKAQTAFQQGRYWEPRHDCALHYIAEILKQDSNNLTASNLFQQLIQILQTQMENYVQQGDFSSAKQLCTSVISFFPNDAQLQEVLRALEMMEQQASMAAEAEIFLVSHDHTGDFMGFCMGYLYIYPDKIVFQVIQTNDGRADNFQATRSQIKEFKTNRWPIGGYSCFHIKFKDGRNFNFAHIDENGMNLDPGMVVDAFTDFDQ